MSTGRANPYNVGHQVHGKDHVGRIDLLEQVLTGPRECWCIFGLRRFGKTSLLLRAAYLAQERNLPYVPLIWNIQGCHNEDSLIESLRFSISESDSIATLTDFTDKDLDEPGGRRDLLALLRRLTSASRRGGRKLLLLCDECESLCEVGRLESGLLGRLRTVFQSTNWVRTVMVGSRQLAEVYDAKMAGSAFLDGFETTWLPPLLREEIAALAGLGLTTNPDLIRDLGDFTFGHPILVQAACWVIFNEHCSVEDSIGKVELTDYYANIKSAFEQDYLYLTDHERDILLTLREVESTQALVFHQRLGVAEAIVSRLLLGLKKSCYVKQGVGGQWALANAFFQKWFSEKSAEGLQHLVEVHRKETVREEAMDYVVSKGRTAPVSQKTSYNEFVCLFTGPGSSGKYQVRILESPAGEATEPLKLNPNLVWIQDGLRKLEAGYTGTRLFEELGTALFKAIFHGRNGELYHASVASADKASHGMRLRFRIEPPELLELPWELLFDPSRHRFVARSPHTPLSIYVESPNPPPTLDVKPPLRVMVIVSSPVNLRELRLPELDVAKEKDQIARALSDWIMAKDVTLEIMDNAVVPNVHDRMRHFQPHVVHFIGHSGRIEGKDQGVLVLEDEHRKFKFMGEENFCELVEPRICRLVVLNACKTAESSAVRGMAGIAPRLVLAGIPAVVAMRYPILDDAAITFSREFYRALASGLAVDAAVADARKGLFLDEESTRRTNRSWFMPVVLMRAPDGRLFDVADR